MNEFIIKIKKLIMLVGDVAGLYLALYLTLIFRYSYPLGHLWQRHLSAFSIVFIIWLIGFFINNFYDLKISYNTSHLLNLLVKIFVINTIVAVIFFYLTTNFFGGIKPQRVLLIDVILSIILIFGWRRIFYQLIKSPSLVNQVLIIGRTPLSEKLMNEINRRTQLGYKAIIIPQASEDLPLYCLENKIDILISAYDLKNHPNTSKKIFNCLSLGVDVYNITSFYEQITNKVPVEYIEHSWFLENLSEHSKKFYEITKRLMDIILAIIGLIMAIPLSPFIALIIKLSSPGPVIFKQTRVGKNNNTFTAMKFRSMVADSEKNGPQWTQKNDPRVTRFGKFIRRTRLDEIPQLINILKGEMSFVGPRPEQLKFVSNLNAKIPFYNERLLVKPGLAGWAQLNAPHHGASEKDSLEKLEYDLYYIKNRSLILDLNIILKTIKVVIGRKGQ